MKSVTVRKRPAGRETSSRIEDIAKELPDSIAVMKIALDNIPQGGLLPDANRKRSKLWDKLDAIQGKGNPLPESIELEDEEQLVLNGAFKGARWFVRDGFISTVEEDVEKATDKKNK